MSLRIKLQFAIVFEIIWENIYFDTKQPQTPSPQISPVSGGEKANSKSSSFFSEKKERNGTFLPPLASEKPWSGSRDEKVWVGDCVVDGSNGSMDRSR